MKNNKVRGYIVLAIIFVVFSVCALAIPFSKTVVFWLAYLFATIAIAFQIYVFRISFSEGKEAKSKFYGFPIAQVGVMYLFAQLGISVIEMALANIISVWVLVVINIFPIAFAVIGCIAAEFMRDEIVRQDVEFKKNVSNMHKLQSATASFVSMSQDSELKKILQELAEDFKYSDPVSSDDTIEIENELKNLVAEIQHTLIDGDINAISELCKNER